MTKFHFPSNRFAFGLALAAILVLIFSLSAAAQGPDGDSSILPDKTEEVEEQETKTGMAPDELENRDSPPAQGGVRTEEEEVEMLTDSENRSTSWFKFISANTFVPYESGMSYEYYNAGCMYRTGGGNYTEHTLQLPEGAEIDYVRLFFYDNDPSHNASATLYAYDGYGNSASLAFVSSSGAVNGYRTEGSGYFSHIVDNEAEALSLALNYGGATNSSLRICGIRIRYQYTGFYGTFLPYFNN